MSRTDNTFGGLTSTEVSDSRKKHGENRLPEIKSNYILTILRRILGEPMILLLLTASVLYLLHRDTFEAIFLFFSILIVYSISQYQENRSEKALQALRKLSQPKARVIRDHSEQEILSEELVVGDLMVVEEGSYVPADGVILQAHDFSVDESILTGESLSIQKSEQNQDKRVFQGTYALTGRAICKVEYVGAGTQTGKIGKSLQVLVREPSPLQTQLNTFVKGMAIGGLIVFVIIWIVNFFTTRDFLTSLLNSLTLAMSLLPEEIPVAFATFMALGSRRLMHMGIIVKNTLTVETLGAATVICVDKTGTITRNEMALHEIYVHTPEIVFTKTLPQDVKEVVQIAVWASEPVPFDPMEKAIHQRYEELCSVDLRGEYSLVHEYPLSGKPPLMTHVFENKWGDRIIAAKGAAEAIIACSILTSKEREIIDYQLQKFVSQGYRVLAVGQATEVNELPAVQQSFKFTFKGLLAFYDPPKENIQDVITGFYDAGIKVKILTGDNALTTANIAGKVGFRKMEKKLSGEEVMQMTDHELILATRDTNLFARMFPEAKLKVIQALKKDSEIVAMTGDGVNDAPALKAAHIGIAMGLKGSEIAKQASALILIDDNLARMNDAIAVGRNIYNNLKKAVQYIISIHIPIILIVFVPLVLGWIYPAVFSPVHVIFLELIMGPTCSIIYENEPIEKDVMKTRPRIFGKTFFRMRELVISVIQGIVIAAGLLAIYLFAVSRSASLPYTTSMIFVSLITANITLTLTNRSFTQSLLKTLQYRNKLIPFMIFITTAIVVLLFAVEPFRNFFHFTIINVNDVLLSVGVGFASVIWFEFYKWFKRRNA